MLECAAPSRRSQLRAQCDAQTQRTLGAQGEAHGRVREDVQVNVQASVQANIQANMPSTFPRSGLLTTSARAVVLAASLDHRLRHYVRRAVARGPVPRASQDAREQVAVRLGTADVHELVPALARPELDADERDDVVSVDGLALLGHPLAGSECGGDEEVDLLLRRQRRVGVDRLWRRAVVLARRRVQLPKWHRLFALLVRVRQTLLDCRAAVDAHDLGPMHGVQAGALGPGDALVSGWVVVSWAAGSGLPCPYSGGAHTRARHATVPEQRHARWRCHRPAAPAPPQT